MLDKVKWIAVCAVLMGLIACAPTLPVVKQVDREMWLEQNWSDDSRQWFHHVSQGTTTLVVPFEWFVALEQPTLSLLGNPPFFSDTAYLQRFGFIPSKKSTYNRAGLPVGFAVDTDFVNPVTNEKYNALGLTCSACHSGQMTYQGTAIRYDGAPAVTNLTTMVETIGLALVYTKYVPFRFDRFAKRVLADNYNKQTKAALKKKFGAVLKALEELKKQGDKFKKVNVEEGFTRVDALNRIGNQVFAEMYKKENYAAITAPVNYPHIWTSSWFDWVQYDASIMQPMVRNAGEALGVAAPVNLHSDTNDKYASTARIRNLDKIEKLLAGSIPYVNKSFDGLRAPQWPVDVLGKIDEQKKQQGESLYQDLCVGCHLPATNSEEFWNAKYWTAPLENGMRYLRLPNIPIEKIGTDPAQAKVITDRKVNTEGLGLNTEVCVCEGESCSMISVKDNKNASFALSLGVVVQNTITHWYNKNNISELERQRMNGYRPNCLQAELSYKARPLNGIWATAPYLHNGSVPNLYALLSPQTERPAKFYLGNTEFDPTKVGYKIEKISGGFEMDTSIAGNLNTGHEFMNVGGKRQGVIGRQLNHNERMALIEYLKSL